MKAIRLLMLIATGVMLMMGINSCDNKKHTDGKSSAQSKESSVKAKVGSAQKLVLIDFYATWCGPCKAMTPVMEQMEQKYGDRIEFQKVDVDQNEELARKYNVMSIPNIVILSPDEEVLENIVGYHDADEMEEILNKVLER